MNIETAMVQAYRNALGSPDPSTQNGAVLLKNGGVLGNGCNNFPPGVDEQFWHGAKADKYARVVHAETYTILDAARNGYSVLGSTLVCPWAACSNCAKHIAASGVQTLVRHTFANSGVTTGSHWYEDCLVGDEILRSSGVEIIEMDPIPTAEIALRRDGELWTP
jgi:deoxycytidylate deaminase